MTFYLAYYGKVCEVAFSGTRSEIFACVPTCIRNISIIIIFSTCLWPINICIYQKCRTNKYWCYKETSLFLCNKLTQKLIFKN